MKFLKLEILNLASLDRKDGETIDFETGALGDSNIFSIVGPTGSGKSTILDAICLALYNRAPRYPRKKGEQNQNIKIFGTPEEGENNRLAPTDCRNILTRGRKNGYSKLTFLANNGKVYRAEWSVRFKSVKYDNVVTALYEISPEGKENEASWEDLPAIIGLDYDQFLSTVLIAQGSFAKFIGAKENERYELLEKLIGCEELYSDIAKEIKQQRDSAVMEHNKVKADCDAYGKDIIAPDEIELLKERIRILEEEENKVKTELVKVTASLEWFTAERKHNEDIELYKSAKAIAEKDLENAKSDIARLGLHDSTLDAVALYKSISESEKTIGELENELRSLDEKISGKESEIKNGNTELESLKKAETDAALEFDKQKPHIDKARTLKGELDSASKAVKEKEQAKNDASTALESAKKEVSDNSTAINNAEQALKGATEAFNGLKTEVDRKKKELEEKAKQDADAYDAENAKLAGIDAVKLQDAKSQSEQKKNDLKEAIRILGDIKSKTGSIAENDGNKERLSKRNQAIDNELKALDIDNLKKELETLNRTYTLMTSEDWATHRHGLEDGKPCPLCGATSHPYSSDDALAPVTNDLSRLISEKESELGHQSGTKENSLQISLKTREKLTVISTATGLCPVSWTF